MSSRLAQVAVSARDTSTLASFWCDVLGWQELERDDLGYVSIGPPDGGPGIDVLPVPEAKSGKNRLHLDLRADGDRDAELARLLALGARRVDIGQAPDVSWTVLADPEGNEFCLL
jgi:catechol 2,3-dioxygenase-like lactoylglutathione lyase family enzyme